jgi:hypothetical protein
LKATYFNQDGEFVRKVIIGAPEENADNNFWVVDAAVTYRLPQRYGFVAVGATNIFDKQFNYFDIDIKNPSVQPARAFFVKVTLALP